MTQSIHRYFKIGTIQWMSFPELSPLDAVRRLTRDAYFDAVELCGFANQADRDAARALLAQSHMTSYFGAQPKLLGTGLNPNDLNEEGRLAAQRAIFSVIDEAAAMGSRGIAFMAGKWNAEHRQEAFEQLLKTTDAVCGYAGDKGLSVNLEVFDYDMDKAVLIGPAPYAAQFAEEAGRRSKNFGLLADLSHFPTTYETSAFVVSTLKPYIRHLHIGNAVVKRGAAAYGDQHPRFGFPESSNDIPELSEFLRVLKSEGFFRKDSPMTMSFEVKPRPGEDAESVLADCKRCLDRAWDALEEDL